MKKLFLVLSLWALASLAQAGAYDVTRSEVESVARHAWQVLAEVPFPAAPVPQMGIEGDGELWYVEFASDAGFLILPADKRLVPLLAYGFRGGLKDRGLNTSLGYLLEGYASEVLRARSEGGPQAAWVNQLWQQWLGGSAKAPTMGISPLLSTEWGQGCYYNTDCPVDQGATGYYCYHVPTGCVATAMAQIMRYHAYPAQGTGTHIYLHPSYGILSVDYSNSTYDWSQMPDYLSSPAPEVARLMYHCGVGVNMDYGPVSSGAYASGVRTALVTFLGYSGSAIYQQKVSFSDAAWNDTLRSSLDKGLPVFYGGVDPNGFGGHAWVVDGYQGNYYHINWGWDGAHNGYFLLNSLNPTGNANFTNFHEAVLGIEPASPSLKAKFALEADTVEVGDSVRINEFSQGNPSTWLWTFYDQYGVVTGTDNKQQPDPRVYTVGGVYDVRLIVSDGLTQDTLLRHNVVTVLPIAAFDASSRRVVSGFGSTVDFTDASVSWDPIVSWNWGFGTGSSAASPPTSNQQDPSGIAFPTPGSHKVSLQIMTQGGKTGLTWIDHYIDAFPSCDTVFAAKVPSYQVRPIDQASFGIGNYDLDGNVPYYAAAGHTSDWHVYNDVIAPGDTNFFYGATSWFTTPGQGDDWLVFGPLSIPSGGAYLEWEHLYWLNNKRDAYELLVSTVGGQPAHFTAPPLKAFIDNDPHTDGHTDWTPVYAELDSLSFGSQQVWIAFHHYGNDMAYVFLDDFRLTSCLPWTGLADGPGLRSDLHVYPNPANEQIIVRIPADIQRASLSIHDLGGRLIRQMEVECGTTEQLVPLGGIAPGLYRISLNDGVSVRGARFCKVM